MAQKTEKWRSLYPFESKAISIGGFKYHYLDEGKGPVLLLVHGNPTWSFYWREAIKALRGGYRLIVPDHIGCGLSDRPDPERYPYRLARRIDDLGTLVAKLNLKQITLVGHDWGGAVGVGVAGAQPQRFSRFVMMNAIAFPHQDWPPLVRLCRSPLVGKVSVQRLNVFVKAMLRSMDSKRRKLAPEVKQGYLAPYATRDARMPIYQFLRDIPLGNGHTSSAPLGMVERTLAKFRNHPVCLIWGMQDPLFSRSILDRWLGYFPDAEVHRINNVGHYALEETPDRVIPLMQEFLEAHPPATAGKAGA